MYSQFFILSLRGDTLIFKDCKFTCINIYMIVIELQMHIMY